MFGPISRPLENPFSPIIALEEHGPVCVVTLKRTGAPNASNPAPETNAAIAGFVHK